MPKPKTTPPPTKSDEDLSEHLDLLRIQNERCWYLQHHGIDIFHNELYMFGREEFAGGWGDQPPGEPGIEYTLANQFIKNINFVSTNSPEGPVLIHMKSCGGYWEEGMAIYDAIRLCPMQTINLCYTHARSMTSIIYLASDKRVMMPHATYMIHRGTIGLYGTGTQFRTEYKQWERTEDLMFDIYADHLRKHGSMKGKSKKSILKWLDAEMKEKEEVHFTAEESVEIGWADEVFDGDWERLREI